MAYLDDRDRRFDTPPPPPPPDGGGAPGGGYTGIVGVNPGNDFTGTFGLPEYGGASSPHFNFGDIPAFHAPRFRAPTAEDAQNSPGYQFRLGQGEGALQNSAAARGVLRTGGTLKDILQYGQDYASAEYQNVFNRALSTYDRTYQAAKDTFAPQLLQYSTLAGAEQARAIAAFNRDWERYVYETDFNKDAFYRGQTPPPVPPGGVGYGG